MSKPRPVVAGLRRTTWAWSTPAERPAIVWWPASRPGYDGETEAAPRARPRTRRPVRRSRYRRGRIQFVLTA